VKLLRGKCEAVFALNASYLYYIICKLSKTRYFTVSRKYRRYSSYLSDIHETNRYLSILKDAKLCTEATKTVLKIPIQVINEYDKVFSSYISKNSLNIGMVPSASCEAKRWQAEKYASIADWLVDKYNANVIFLGSKSDCAIIDRIKSMMRHYPGDLSGKTTIAGLIYMISKLDYFISNDTGPMQIADALSVPLLAIFGPSNHKRFGPLNTRSKILRENLSCNPCNYNFVHFNCKSFICMDNISVESAKSIISSSLIKLH
jgi:ADP-heptose:LPS heptosyltransferase